MTAARTDLADELEDRKILTLDRFVSPAVRRRILLEMSEAQWAPSRVESVAPTSNTAMSPGTGRSSSTLILEQPSTWTTVALRRIERSLRNLLGIEPAYLEPWQITCYKRAEAYDYHVDCGCWGGHASGERRRTILIYIEQPVRGGATDFRALRKRILPLAGRLVVWDNLLANGNCNHAMIHSGRPVWQGRKTILTTWEHQAPFIR